MLFWTHPCVDYFKLPVIIFWTNSLEYPFNSKHGSPLSTIILLKESKEVYEVVTNS